MKRTLICVALALAGLGTGVHAADLAPLFGQPEDGDALPPPDFVLGTGWYLRGDLTATDDIKPDVLGSLNTDRDRRDWNYGLGGGAGYKFNEYFRADLTGDYFGPQKTVENFYASYGSAALKANFRRFDVLANAYVDLGTYGGFTPYIGAGVGFAGLRLDGSYALEAPAYGVSVAGKVPGKTTYDLAWAAMAGVAYNVTPNLIVDVGYRYLDLGTYTVPRFTRSPFNEGARTDLNSHQIRAGVRYMIY